MEKLIFLFRRKPEASRQQFYDYYVNIHNPLGMALNPGIMGYTVNFVLSDGTDVDAVTEIWTPSATDMITGKTFRTPEDRAKSIADGQAFLGPADMFWVEEIVLVDGDLQGQLGEGPWPKTVSLHRDDPGEAPPDAFRVVDNHVVQTFRSGHRIGEDSEDEAARELDIATIRMVWTDDIAIPPPVEGPTMLRVRERRELFAPNDADALT